MLVSFCKPPLLSACNRLQVSGMDWISNRVFNLFLQLTLVSKFTEAVAVLAYMFVTN